MFLHIHMTYTIMYEETQQSQVNTTDKEQHTWIAKGHDFDIYNYTEKYVLFRVGAGKDNIFS